MRVQLATLLSLAAFGTGASPTWGQAMSVPRDEFVIYRSDSPAPMYEANAEWQAFVAQGQLGPPLVREADIAAYDWDNQALILTSEASRSCASVRGRFIAVLGERRLYGLHGLDRISAMGVRQPVVYREEFEGRVVLLLRVSHMFGKLIPLVEPRAATIAAPAVRERFARIHKLQQPHSEPGFSMLRDSVARIRVLGARATEEGVEIEYVLHGHRAGQYSVSEGIGLSWGLYGAHWGPTRAESLELAVGETTRRALFRFEELGKYWYERNNTSLAQRKGESLPEPYWVLSVWVRPVLSPSENAGIGLVERMHRQPNKGWASALDDSQSAKVPLDWSRIERR